MKNTLGTPLVVALTVLFCYSSIAAATGEKYALVIGITGYSNLGEKGSELRYADRDAADFAAFIQTPAGGSFPADHVHLVIDQAATRDKIFAEFKWLYKTAGPNDLVYVFFAGHGSDFQNESYLLPINANKDNLDSEGIPMRQFFQKVTTDLAAMQVVVFIDACRAAAAVGGARDPGEFDVAKQWEQHNAKEGQVAMGFFSSLANEKSFEDPDLGGGHGLFTWYLLEGLKGGAQRTPEGWITAANLLDYVRSKVETRSQQQFQSRQTPNGTPDFRTGFTLAYSNSGPPASADTRAFGFIEVSSVERGTIYIDGNDVGQIFENGTKRIPNQAVGHHQVQFKAEKGESIDLVVENGAIAEAHFGIVSPIDDAGKVPTGGLYLDAVGGLSGEVYIDNYRVGHLDVGKEITITHIIAGNHTCRVTSPNGVVNTVTVDIRPNVNVGFTLAPPTGLTATVQ
jgi:hypothetical protein